MIISEAENLGCSALVNPLTVRRIQFWMGDPLYVYDDAVELIFIFQERGDQQLRHLKRAKSASEAASRTLGSQKLAVAAGGS